ncbi:MAG TPA: hypothetical protein VJO13_09875 [Ktedonobacterales bacterium]|nr:hypothetical protein [Ktedonobacterales bacterium]
MASARVEAPSGEMSVQALRGQLAAGGMTGPALDDALELVQKVGDEPAYATRLRQVLTQSTGLAQAMLAAAPRVASAWAIVGLMALTALAGPLLAYALFETSSQTATAIGDPFQVYATHLPGWAGLAAGVIGAALLIVFLLLVASYQRPTLLGLFGGLAGGIVEVIAAVLPWVGIVGAKTTCAAGSGCTVQPGVPEQIGLVAALCFAIPFVLAVTGVSGTLALWLQRRRMLAAIRSA